MINQIYQLTKPKFINIKYQEEEIDQENHILIRPNYMAVCHADQRYYQGKRSYYMLQRLSINQTIDHLPLPQMNDARREQ